MESKDSLKARLDKLRVDLTNEPVEETENALEFAPQGFRRKLFVDEYMIDFNGAAAARRAGYSEASAASMASELLTNADIKQEIVKRQNSLRQRNELSKDYIIQTLYRIMDDSENAEDRNAMLKAVDIMNKMMGNYVQTNVNINVTDQPLFPDTQYDDAEEVKD